ncbi:MAG: KH domain-containing protein [Nanoarchaeota archaeon]
MELVRIPKERVAVLIGKKGATKRLIERNTKTKLTVDKEGTVVINGESIEEFEASSIVKAIGRGFNPEIALTLLNEENCMEIISIKDFAGKSEKKFYRTKSRLIGTKGKAREVIEKLTETRLSIYGKTVAIIGKIENVSIAKRGTEILLRGAPHGNAYKYIEREMNNLKEQL